MNKERFFECLDCAEKHINSILYRKGNGYFIDSQDLRNVLDVCFNDCFVADNVMDFYIAVKHILNSGDKKFVDLDVTYVVLGDDVHFLTCNVNVEIHYLRSNW